MGSPFFNQHRFDECISIISLPYIYKLNLEIYSYTHPNKVEESNSRMLVIQSTERPSSGISLSSNNFTRHIPVYSQRIEASPPSRRGGGGGEAIWHTFSSSIRESVHRFKVFGRSFVPPVGSRDVTTSIS